MNKFEEMYLKIINDSWKYPSIQTKLTKKLIKENKHKHIFLDLNKILTETIKAVELTPVPNQVLIQIFKHLNKLNNYVYSISYQQIINIIQKSEYQLQDVFIKNLNKYATDPTGNLYLIKLDLKNKNNFNNTINTLNNLLQDNNRMKQFYNILQKDYFQNGLSTKGLTIIKRNIQINRYKNCLIYLNKELNGLQFKDTCQHEFTHFIQRICSFDKNLPKIFNYENIYQFDQNIDNILSNIIIKSDIRIKLQNFLKFKLDISEQHQTIKSMIKFFIRQYQNQSNKILFNHKYLTINQLENSLDKNNIQKFRQQWLNNLINNINNYSYFSPFKKQFNEYLISAFDPYVETNNETINIKKCLFGFIYLIIDYKFPHYNIKQLMFNQFQKFKFKHF